MARERIPREVLTDRLRQFVLRWRDNEVWEVAEDKGGSLMSQLQDDLGREFGDPETWRIEVASNSFLTEEERRDVYDVLWSYVEAGILKPITGGPRNQSRNAWAELYRTAYGRRVLEGDAPLPEDIDEFLRRFVADAPQLDTTTRFFVEQALRAFRAKLFPATAVLIGCAAERIMDCLAQALGPKLPPMPRGKLNKAITDGPLAEVWKVFRSHFDSYRTSIFAPHGLARSAETGLDGLLLVVKRARDDNGHPTEVHLSENEVRALLQVFLEHARYASIALEGIATLPAAQQAAKSEGGQ